MNLILWIIFGAIVGWLSAIFTGTNGTMHGHHSVLVGIVATVISGLIINFVFHESLSTLNVYSLLSAVFVASVVLWLWETHHAGRDR